MALTLSQIKDLKSGDRVRVTWSGGNGPHEYVISRRADGAIDCRMEKCAWANPGCLFDPIADRSATVLIHKVELA